MSRCFWALSLSVLEVLLCLDSVLKVPSLPLRRVLPMPASDDVGDDEVELAEEMLPKSLWVDSGTFVSSESHQGQFAFRVSQPSSLSFSGQFARLLAG